MKCNAVLVSAACVLVASAGYWMQSVRAQATRSDAAALVRALETELNAAIAHRDVAALDRLTGDDCTFITPRGLLTTKAELLDALAKGEFTYEYRQIYDLRVRVYGEAAVVTGRALYSAQRQGRDYSDAYRYTRVYVRQNGRWLAVAWQATREDVPERDALMPAHGL